MKDNFLKDFVSLGDNTEIPGIFLLWCGLSTISSVLARRVWVDMGTYTVFPNMYVVLVAGSGRCRKSTAIGLVEKVLGLIDPRPNMIAQRITPEALIEALQVVETTDTKKFLKKKSEGFVIVDELSTFLNRKTYESGLASLLIPLYDCKDTFSYRTRGRGVEMIQNSCLGILGGSTVDWIRSSIPADAIGGGLTSRIVFVYVEKPPPPVAITVFTEENRRAVERLVRVLQDIASISGEVLITDDAKAMFVEVYNKFYTESELFHNPTLSGYASRRHVHMLKIGMCLAASEGQQDSLVIDVNHLEGAKALLKQSELFMPRVLSLIVASERGNVTEIVFTKIASFKKMPRKVLLRGMSHRLDSRELAEIIDTLKQSGRITIDSSGSEIYYKAL